MKKFQSKSFNQEFSYLLTNIIKKLKKKHLITSSKYSIEMDSTETKMKTISRTVLRIIHGFVELIVRILFKIIYGSTGESMPPIKDLILLESATSLAHKIRTKKLTSVQVVESFIARINEINPLLNCVVTNRFKEALDEAKKVDTLITSGILTQEELAKDMPFLGVPFTTKDCIEVKGLCHTAGLYCRRNIIGTEDAEVIVLLKKAGAIPIALTNVSELCMWWESGNTIHGRSRNPYDVNRTVGGSSGGEGCIQAAAGSAFGIGSDIGGSIRIPSFFNGIFGHKPSPGVVSNAGQYPSPVSKEQASFLGIGPMVRRAEDLMPIFKILVNKNAERLKLDEPVKIENLKFFYQESDLGGKLVSPVSKDIREAMRKAVQHLEKTHKIKPEKMQIKHFNKSMVLWLANMKTEGPTFAEQLANLNGSICISFEFLKWSVGQSQHTFIGLMTALIEKFGIKYGSSKHEHLISKRNQFKHELLDILGENGVLLYPTHPTAAPYHHEPLFKPFNFSYTAVVNVLGLPATHIPMGLGSEGLPIGIQVIAAPDQDRLCIAVANELEKAFGGWVPPQINV